MLVLMAVHADKGETNTLDKDIVNLGVNEDVVDEQRALGNGKIGNGSVSIRTISTRGGSLFN
jgi:hypothetical protein